MAQKKLTDVVWESLNGREPETEDSVFKEVISWLCIISVAVLLAFLLNNFVIVNAKVTSGSMESTIMTGDRVLGLRASYWFDQPQFGDVVFFRYPDDERKIYVKRVIGVPGRYHRDQRRHRLPERSAAGRTVFERDPAGAGLRALPGTGQQLFYAGR